MHLVGCFLSKRGASKGLVLLIIVSMSASYIIALDKYPDHSQLHASAYVNPPSGGGGVTVPTIPSVEVITLLSAREAAMELKSFQPKEVAKVLTKVGDIEHVANIVSYFSPEYALSVLKNMAPLLTSRILLLLDRNEATSLLLDLSSVGYIVVGELIERNYNETVVMLEGCVKKALELDEEARELKLAKLSEAVGTLDKTRLVGLLISMSGLPDTPATVAHLIGSMSLSRVIDVVDEWIGNELYNPSRSLLVTILGFLDSELVDEIYCGVTDHTRLVLLEIMPEDMRADLPVVGNFIASSLKVSSSQVEQGEALELEYVLENQGGSTDDYLVPVKINGVTNFIDEGILASNESVTLTHELDTPQTGLFVVDVLGQTIEYNVTSPMPIIVTTPFSLSVISIEVVPEEVERGKDITIFTTVKNMGETAGTSDVELVIDSMRVYSKEVYLEGGDSVILFYEFPADYDEGTHMISIIDAESDFKVINPPFKMPWFTVTTVVVILAIAAYYKFAQR